MLQSIINVVISLIIVNILSYSLLKYVSDGCNEQYV